MKILLVSLLFGSSSYASDCIRVEKPVARMIYLHGMDSLKQSDQEKRIIKTLESVSKKQTIEIYLPRASMKCPTDASKVCWMWNIESRETLVQNKEDLLKQAASCFRSTKPLIWFGFSNGGNRLNQFFQGCLPGKYLTIGSSGGQVSEVNPDLSNCGELYSAIGNDDVHNLARVRELSSKMIKAGGKIKLIEFEGGHEVKIDVMERLLKSALK